MGTTDEGAHQSLLLENRDARPDNDVSDRQVLVSRPAYDRRTFDAKFQRIPPEELTWRQRLSLCCGKCRGCCLPRRILRKALNLVPLVGTLRNYQWRKDLLMDFVAGLSVSMVHIPQGMGFALLAAVAPIYGLYASFWQVLFYMMLGSCRHLSIGTMAVISLLIGAVVEREVVLWKANRGDVAMTSPATHTYGVMNNDSFSVVLDPGVTGVTWNGSGLNLSSTVSPEGTEDGSLSEEDRFRSSVACGVSLIAAITMFGMGVFRLGVITNFMPTSFIGGFTTAAAFHITTTQLKPLLNVAVKRHGGMFNLPLSLFEVIKAVPQTNPGDFVISVLTIAFLVFIKEFINIRYRSKLKIPIPAEMIVVVLVTVLSFALNFSSRWGVKVIGHIPPGIPVPAVPNLERASTYVIDGMVAGVTSFAISISMVDILASKHKYEVDANQELVAYGLTYGVSAFLHSFVGAAAPPRCFVMELTGGKTQVASVFTAVLLLLVLLVIAPVFRFLPNASLASIIVVALAPLFKQFKQLPHLWRVSKPDLFIWVVTFIVSVVVDVSVSLFVGIILAIITAVYPALSSRGYVYGADERGQYNPAAPVSLYEGLSATKDVLVFRYESTLYFVTIKNFKAQLYRAAFNPLQRTAITVNGPAKHDLTDGNQNEDAHPMNDLNFQSGEGEEEEERSRDIKVIVLDASPITYVDLMGVNALKQLRAAYLEVGVELVLADCNPHLITKLRDHGLIDTDKGDTIPIYPTVQDAVIMLSH